MVAASSVICAKSTLSCISIGEGNGNPLQCSCLENPRGRGAWWAAVYGVAQSRPRLKQVSSSSSYRCSYIFICCLLFRSRKIEELRMNLHFLKLSVAPPWTDLEMVFSSFSLSLCAVGVYCRVLSNSRWSITFKNSTTLLKNQNE